MRESFNLTRVPRENGTLNSRNNNGKYVICILAYTETSAGSESDLGWYDTDPRSGALVLYVTLVELVLYRCRRPEIFRYNTV
jgi:hypothetical protein